jgi:hypothetical protein
MTIQRSFFNWGSSGLNYNIWPYETCSPNLVQLLLFLQGQCGGYSLGCEGDRTIRDGSSISSHSYGAAFDWRYTPVPSGVKNVTRDTAVKTVLPWVINNSAELGIQAIHDYAGDRIWRAGRTSNVAEAQTTWWKKQYGAGGGMGESWATYFHFETTKDKFMYANPVKLRSGIVLPGGGTTNQIATPPGYPSMSKAKGSTDANTVVDGWPGGRVSTLQRILGGITVDGYFGSQTDAKLRQVQEDGGLIVDGIYGTQCEQAFLEWRGI